MEAIALIGFLILFSTLIYVAYHFIQKIKQKDRTLSKKIINPLLIGGFLLFFFGLVLSDPGDSEKLKEALAENEALSAEVKSLELSHEETEEKFNELNDMVEGLNDEIEDLKEINEALTGEKEELAEANTSLEEEVESLTEENKELQAKASTDKPKETASTNTDSSQSTGSTSKSESTSTSTETSTDTASSSSTSESTSTAAAASQDCDIKGSNSGIYHTPGSTYYDRTTNVAQWFCSEEEARDAGYRAPKR